MDNSPSCRICGKIAPLYTETETILCDMPYMRVHTFYCEECAKMIENFEIYLVKMRERK